MMNFEDTTIVTCYISDSREFADCLSQLLLFRKQGVRFSCATALTKPNELQLTVCYPKSNSSIVSIIERYGTEFVYY